MKGAVCKHTAAWECLLIWNQHTDSEGSGFLGQLLPFVESETCEYNETSESQNKTVWSIKPLLQEVNVASGQMLHLLQEVNVVFVKSCLCCRRWRRHLRSELDAFWNTNSYKSGEFISISKFIQNLSFYYNLSPKTSLHQCGPFYPHCSKTRWIIFTGATSSSIRGITIANAISGAPAVWEEKERGVNFKWGILVSWKHTAPPSLPDLIICPHLHRNRSCLRAVTLWKFTLFWSQYQNEK